MSVEQLKELGNLYATYNMMTRKLTTVVNGQNMEQPIRMGNPGVVGKSQWVKKQLKKKSRHSYSLLSRHVQCHRFVFFHPCQACGLSLS